MSGARTRNRTKDTGIFNPFKSAYELLSSAYVKIDSLDYLIKKMFSQGHHFIIGCKVIKLNLPEFYLVRGNIAALPVLITVVISS